VKDICEITGCACIRCNPGACGSRYNVTQKEEKRMDMNKIIKMMQSEDYRERFKAEYWQLKDRYEKLKAFNTKIEAAQAVRRPIDPWEESPKTVVEMPKHDCPEWILKEQQAIMGNYLHMLEMRAVIEGIDLSEV